MKLPKHLKLHLKFGLHRHSVLLHRPQSPHQSFIFSHRHRRLPLPPPPPRHLHRLHHLFHRLTQHYCKKLKLQQQLQDHHHYRLLHHTRNLHSHIRPL